MRDSDWSRKFLLRSDWLGPSVALITTIDCYELKGDLSLVMLKELFHDSFENFESTRICMENHASRTG